MMAAAAILSSLLLLASRHWLNVILAIAAFLTPAILKVFAFAGQEGKPRRLLLSLATVRFLILFLVSLFAMQIPFPGQGALGGKRI
jgi:hypothetical protein